MSHPFAIVGVLVCLTSAAMAQVAPDADYHARQERALTLLAEVFSHRTYGQRDYVRLGRESSHLAAKFEAHERGLAGGLDPSTATADGYVHRIAEAALAHLGTTTTPGPYSWDTVGSPAVMYAAQNLGLILHRWGDRFPVSTRELMCRALSDTSWPGEARTPHLVNGRLSIIAGQLLAGEALGYDSDLWRQGAANLQGIYDRTTTRGGIEMNASLYSMYHYPPLMLLQDLRHEGVRNQARILLEYELIVSGHLYLPGGGLGAPRARDRAGGVPRQVDGLQRINWLLLGEPALDPTASFHYIAAATRRWQPPAVIRSLYLDKGRGYHFWAYTDAPAAGRMPGTGYALGPDNVTIAPWHAVVSPDGRTIMGISYGHRYQAIHVSMGVMARADDGRFLTLYHHQPWNEGDRTAANRRLPSDTDGENPFLKEGYQYERLMHHRTMLSIWEPTQSTFKGTQAHVPHWDQHPGGQALRHNGWHIGLMGRTYIAYRPLGPIVHQEDKGPWTLLQLDGVSGCVIELATTEQFATLQAYAVHLSRRRLVFDRQAKAVEFDGLDPDTGRLTRMRLECSPERRWLDGRPVTMRQIDPGFINSPFIRWDANRRQMHLQRPEYEGVLYDFRRATLAAIPSRPAQRQP